MIVVYSRRGTNSTHIVTEDLRKHKLPFIIKTFGEDVLSEVEVRYMISKCEYDIFDILSTKTTAFKELEMDIEDLTISELIDLIISKPELIRAPMVFSSTQHIFGYTKESWQDMLSVVLKRRKFYGNKGV